MSLRGFGVANKSLARSPKRGKTKPPVQIQMSLRGFEPRSTGPKPVILSTEL